MYGDYEIIPVNGHYEVHQDGKFLFSADTTTEIKNEIEKEN